MKGKEKTALPSMLLDITTAKKLDTSDVMKESISRDATGCRSGDRFDILNRSCAFGRPLGQIASP